MDTGNYYVAQWSNIRSLTLTHQLHWRLTDFDINEGAKFVSLTLAHQFAGVSIGCRLIDGKG
jgi:hypothetical protein